MANVTVLQFLEDIAQQRFLEKLVWRRAQALQVDVNFLEPGNVTGGRGRTVTELKLFLRDLQRGQRSMPDLLVIAVDADCKGGAVRKEIEKCVQCVNYVWPYVIAIPNPHIECWYLADPQGFQELFGGPRQKVPRQKCKKDLYKRLLLQAFRAAGVLAPGGGYEYGEDIAERIDLYRAGRNVAAFRRFRDDLDNALKRFVKP